MALETTTTTLNDLTNASLVEPYLVHALSEQAGLFRFCKEFDLRSKPTNALSIPTETSWWGSANDAGAGVDTEFNATEATALSNTQISTGVVTLTCAEYGVAIQVTDNVGEDSADGLDTMMRFEQRMLHVLSLAMEDDFLALLASLSNVVGTTTVNITIAQFLAAFQGLRTRGVISDSTVCILDNIQAGDLEGLLTATSTSMAVYALSADRILNWQPSGDNGMSANRMISTFRGNPVFTSGLTDTANAGTDVVGAAITPSSAFNDASGHTTFGMGWKRLPTFETQRQAKSRATDLVMTTRAGFVELLDGSGTAIITDN
jgi:hypothetical protein